ncbi:MULTISPECIES: hypothetical protein [unclassified Streptomyces]|uniref:hypothetical protein n=1 Tax=unclassified Streptomyces TaxID=2593676 RepID=UPI0033C298F3
MQYKMLVLTVLVLASVIVGLLAGILQFAGGGRIVGAVQGGAMAFGVSLTLGLGVVSSMRLL